MTGTETIREKLREIKCVMLQPKCLPDCRTVSETPPPVTLLMLEVGDLCQTIFVALQKQKIQHSLPLLQQLAR